MNITFVSLRFGAWEYRATPMFTYERIYRDGHKWTPICLKQFRYIGLAQNYREEMNP